MRDIEFRAWSIVGEEYNSWRQLKSSRYNPEHEDHIKTVEKDGAIGWFNDPDLILEQYTGLLDKNGKKIFEGDVIKDTEDVYGIVFFFNGSFIVDYKHRGIYTLGSRSATDIEIIGNIHTEENKGEGE